MRSIFLLSVILIFSRIVSFSQTVDDKNINDIKKLLEDYQKYSQFTITGASIEDSYAKNFTDMFTPKLHQKIENDLLGKSGDPKDFKTIDAYRQYAVTKYPYGVDVSLNMAALEIVDDFRNGANTGYVVKVNKSITGLYMQTKFFRKSIDLFFFVSNPTEEGGSMMLTGVLNEDDFKRYYGNKTVKGLYLGVAGGYGSGLVMNMEALTNPEIYQFNYVTDIEYNVGLDIMFTRGFGLGTGVFFNNFASEYTIEGYYRQSNVTITDLDGDYYIPEFEIQQMTETRVYTTMGFPFLLKFRTGKGKAAFYWDLGVIYSMVSSGYYTLEGTSTKRGYYPEYKVLLEDVPEYGFESRSFSAEENDLELPSNRLAGYMGFGIHIPIAGGVNMKIGTHLQYGITGVDTEGISQHDYDFANFLENPGQTFLHYGGLELGISYQLSRIWSKQFRK